MQLLVCFGRPWRSYQLGLGLPVWICLLGFPGLGISLLFWVELPDLRWLVGRGSGADGVVVVAVKICPATSYSQKVYI